MGITIDESIKELEKARDSIEPYLFIDETIDQSMKTAVNTMRKYRKIEKIINAPIGGTSAKYNAIVNLIKYSEVEDGKIY